LKIDSISPTLLGIPDRLGLTGLNVGKLAHRVKVFISTGIPHRVRLIAAIAGKIPHGLNG
jgi:hypothetical protein